MSASLSPPVTGWKTLGLLNRYHWFVFVVAALGWLADCLDQQLFNLGRVSAVTELLTPHYSDPKELRDALKEAVQVVKRGQPALIDSVTQPR